MSTHMYRYAHLILTIFPLDGRFWEFTSDLSKGDTAYTSIALGAHTDTTYFVSGSFVYYNPVISFNLTDRLLWSPAFPSTLAYRRLDRSQRSFLSRWSYPPRRRLLRCLHPARAPPRSLQDPQLCPCLSARIWRKRYLWDILYF